MDDFRLGDGDVSYVYLGEKTGGRILRYGTGITQVGSPTTVLATWQTWDTYLAGETGDAVIRALDVAGTTSAAYDLTVTPSIDGVAQTAQRFTGAGTGDGATKNWLAQAFLAERGSQVGATVAMQTRSGDLALSNLRAAVSVIRMEP